MSDSIRPNTSVPQTLPKTQSSSSEAVPLSILLPSAASPKGKVGTFAKAKAAVNLAANVIVPLILGQTYKRLVPGALRFQSLDRYIEKKTHRTALREIVLPLMKWGVSLTIGGGAQNEEPENVLNEDGTLQAGDPKKSKGAALIKTFNEKIGVDNLKAFVFSNINYSRAQFADYWAQPACEDVLTWSWYTFVAGYTSNPRAMRSMIEEATDIDNILKNKFSFLSSDKMWGGDTLRRGVINLMHFLTHVFLIEPAIKHSQQAKYSWAGTVLASNFVGGMRIGDYFNVSHGKKLALGALGILSSYGPVTSAIALATSALGVTSLSTTTTAGLMLQSAGLYVKDPKLQALLTAGNIGFNLYGPLSTVYQVFDSATGLGPFLLLSTMTGGGLMYLKMKHPDILESLGQRSDAFNPLDWYEAEDFAKQAGTSPTNDFNPENLAENRYRYRKEAFDHLQKIMDEIYATGEKEQALLTQLQGLQEEDERLKSQKGSAKLSAKNVNEESNQEARIDNLVAIKELEKELGELSQVRQGLHEKKDALIESDPYFKLEAATLEVDALKCIQKSVEATLEDLRQKGKQAPSTIAWLKDKKGQKKDLLTGASAKNKKLQTSFQNKLKSELDRMEEDVSLMSKQFWQFASELPESERTKLDNKWKKIETQGVSLAYGDLFAKQDKQKKQFESIHKQQVFLQQNIGLVLGNVETSVSTKLAEAEKNVQEQAAAVKKEVQEDYHKKLEAIRELPPILLQPLEVVPAEGTVEATVVTGEGIEVNPMSIESQPVMPAEVQFKEARQQLVSDFAAAVAEGVVRVNEGKIDEQIVREELKDLQSDLKTQLEAAKRQMEAKQAANALLQAGNEGKEAVNTDPIATKKLEVMETKINVMEKTLDTLSEFNVTRLNPLGKGAIGAGGEDILDDQGKVIGHKVNEAAYKPLSVKTRLEIEGSDLKTLNATLQGFATDTNRQAVLNDDVVQNEEVFIGEESITSKWKEDFEMSGSLQYEEEFYLEKFKEIFHGDTKLEHFASNLFSPKGVASYKTALDGLCKNKMTDDLFVVTEPGEPERKLKLDTANPTYKFKILPPEEGQRSLIVILEGTYKAQGEWQVEKEGIVKYSEEKQKTSFVKMSVSMVFNHKEPEVKKETGWFGGVKQWWAAQPDLIITPSLSHAAVTAKVSETIDLS